MENQIKKLIRLTTYIVTVAVAAFFGVLFWSKNSADHIDKAPSLTKIDIVHADVDGSGSGSGSGSSGSGDDDSDDGDDDDDDN